MNSAGAVLVALIVATLASMPDLARADESLEDFVTRYELALDRGDPELLRGVYADWSPERERLLREYFSETVSEFNVEFSEFEVVSSDDSVARIRLLRRDRFTDVISGRRIEKELRLDRTLERAGGMWRLSATTSKR